MKYRLSKIYTRKGDDGYTGLGDARIPKDDLLVEVVGMLDELNSSIGVVLAVYREKDEIFECLQQVQNDLFDMGGELHFPQKKTITENKITWLENRLDELNESLPPLTEFILPGGNVTAATCHLSRTICRRAERCMVKLHRQVMLANAEMLRYLNRLSDLLFVIARVLARKDGGKEVLWRQE